jgi:hypothetical protein
MFSEGKNANDVKELLADRCPDVHYQKKEQAVAHLAKELEDLYNLETLEHNGKPIAHAFNACALLVELTSDLLLSLIALLTTNDSQLQQMRS